MARYIDADKFAEQLRLNYCKDCNSCNGVKCRACEIGDALDFIEDAPTADAVEVKHGEWSVRKYSCTKFITCSVCNGVIGSHTGIDENKFKYCPFCGTKMDGGEAE